MQRTQVEIVCVSPKTGKLYPSTVSLPSDTAGISDAENGTSETSRRIRKETKEIYKEIFSKAREENEAQEEMVVDKIIKPRNRSLQEFRRRVEEMHERKSLQKKSEPAVIE